MGKIIVCPVCGTEQFQFYNITATAIISIQCIDCHAIIHKWDIVSDWELFIKKTIPFDGLKT